MSDTMLHGILQMPPELWSNDPIDVLQRHGRYLEASKRIIELERQLDWALKSREAVWNSWNDALEERDEARREIKELKRAAIEVLKVVPVAYCCEMHHGKRDIHSALDPCPVAERFNAKIDKLRALLKEEA